MINTETPLALMFADLLAEVGDTGAEALEKCKSEEGEVATATFAAWGL